jgi:hypothetical protein
MKKKPSLIKPPKKLKPWTAKRIAAALWKRKKR